MERTLHVIDPGFDVDFHSSLFNAKPGFRFQTLQQYGRSTRLGLPILRLTEVGDRM